MDLDRAEAIISAGPANHSVNELRRCFFCARVHTPLSVFVAAGLDSCPAEAVRPSPTGHASAVYRALGGGPCTYPSWKVRAPMLRFTRQHIPWSRGSACGRHHLFTWSSGTCTLLVMICLLWYHWYPYILNESGWHFSFLKGSAKRVRECVCVCV